MTLAHRGSERVVAAVLARRYELNEVLAVGVGGAMWLGHDRVLSRPVAVKQVTGDGTARTALYEARAAAAVRHPNVVDVHDIVADPSGAQWIVMEALDGEPLHLSILRQGRIGIIELLSVAHGLTEALHALHAGPLTPLLQGLLQPRPTDRWTVADVRAHLASIAGQRWSAHLTPPSVAPPAGAPVLALSR